MATSSCKLYRLCLLCFCPLNFKFNDVHLVACGLSLPCLAFAALYTMQLMHKTTNLKCIAL